MVKLGIFGYGFIAGVHAQALRHVTGAEAVAVCGPREGAAQAFAREHGIARVTTSPDDLLADGSIAGVLVGTPDGTHHDLALRAIGAGKHVFCEKPLARTVEEARELHAAYIDLTHFLLGPIIEVCADLRTVIEEVYDEEGRAHPHRVDDDTALLCALQRGGRTVHGTTRLAPPGSRHAPSVGVA